MTSLPLRFSSLQLPLSGGGTFTTPGEVVSLPQFLIARSTVPSSFTVILP